MKSKRFLCLLLVLLMAFSLTPSETRAETTVYFTAVNDQLLPDPVSYTHLTLPTICSV